MKKIVLPLTQDGDSVAWDRMRPDTQSRFRRILQSSVAADPTVDIDPSEITYVFDALGAIESWVAIRFFHVMPEIANLAFTYSPTEKAILAEPAAKLIKKYAGSMMRYRDECAFAITLYAVHMQKIRFIQEETLRRTTVEAERERDRAARANGMGGERPATTM